MSMNDLQLWQLLQTKSDDDVVLALLEQLADLSLRERFPFFSRVRYLLESDRAAVRRAAIAVIAGGTGHETLEALVNALMDSDDSVRAAAVDALAYSVESDLPRLAHALFHPHADVRRAALGKIEGSAIGWYALFLCEDEAHAELARELVKTVRIEPEALPIIVELHRRGTLPLDDAVSLMLDMRVDQWLVDYPMHPSRSAALVESLRGQSVITGNDIFDDAFDLLVRQYLAEGARGRIVAWFRRLIDELLARQAHEEFDFLARRVWVSLRWVTDRHQWTAPVMEYAAVFDMATLADVSIPRPMRREAIRVLYEARSKLPRSESVVAELLSSDLARRPNGHLDLWAIGGLLFCVAKPYQVLMETFTQNQITAAFLADPEDSCSLFCLPDAKGEQRMKLVQHILKQRKSQADFIAALMVFAVNADGYEFLDKLKPVQAIALIDRIAGLMRKPEWKLASNKRRIAGRYLSRRLEKHLTTFLTTWLERDDLESDVLGLEVLANLAKESKSAEFAQEVLKLPLEKIVRLLTTIPFCPGFPYGHELVLATHLQAIDDEMVLAWVAERVPASTSPAREPTEPIASGTPLTATQAREITAASDKQLEHALLPALEQPRAGVASALSDRAPTAHPHVTACCALLGSIDPLVEVDAQFARYAGTEPESRLLGELDRSMVKTWETCVDIWTVGHAWLWRWEKHLFAFGELVATDVETLGDMLRLSHELVSVVLRDQIWRATCELLRVLRARENSRYLGLMKPELLEISISGLQTDVGEHAARIIMMFHANSMLSGLLGPHREFVDQISLDLVEAVREILEPWISSKGISAPFVARSVRTIIKPVEKAEIASSTNLEQLKQWCRSPSGGIVDEATLRLLDFGDEGQNCLVDVLAETPLVSGFAIVAESIALWQTGSSMERLRDVLDAEGNEPQRVFMLGLGLLERGESSYAARTLAATADSKAWFRAEDWHRLNAADIPFGLIVEACIVSPQPHAYKPAVNELLVHPTEDTGRQFNYADFSTVAWIVFRRCDMRQRNGSCLPGTNVVLRSS